MRIKIVFFLSFATLAFGWGYLTKAESSGPPPEDLLDEWRNFTTECSTWCSFGGIPFQCDGEKESCTPDPNSVCGITGCGPS